MRNPLQRRKRSSSSPFPLLPNDLDTLIRKIIFPAGYDFEGHQMICICACHFPSPRTIPYDELLPMLINSIDSFVRSEYTLVFFAGQAEHKPSLAWTLSAYQTLERKYRKGIKKLYIAHSGTWTRIILEVAGRIVSPKFAKKVKYIGTLSELAEHVPITQINIPPAVYVGNVSHEDEITLPANYDLLLTRLFGADLSLVMGADGLKGLPRVIIDAIAYLRAEGLATEGLFRIPPLQSLLQHAIAAYDRGHPVDLRDYGPNIAASLIKQYLNMLPMPVFPAHIYPALQKFPTIIESERTEYIQKNVLGRLDPCNTVLLGAIMGFLNDVAAAEILTKMPSINLSIVITLTLLHHPHDPHLDAQLSNPHKNGGAALVVIHMIDHHEEVFPDKPLPPPPMPPRPKSTPPEYSKTTELSPKRFLSEEARSKDSTVRLVSRGSTKSTEEESSPLVGVPTTSLSTPLPSAEFGQVSPLKNRGRNPAALGSGVVDELRRVYEERCKIVKTQEPGRKEGGLGLNLTKPISRGGMGIGIGRVN